MRAAAVRTRRRIIGRLRWGILRSSSALVRRGWRLTNLVVSGRGAFSACCWKGLSRTKIAFSSMAVPSDSQKNWRSGLSRALRSKLAVVRAKRDGRFIGRYSA